jgi:hypothetical protein
MKKLLNQTFQSAAIAALFVSPMLASVGGPVSVTLDSKDKLQAGQPVNVTMTVRAAAAVTHVTLGVESAAGWQLLDGLTNWAGSLSEKQSLELKFSAVPLSEQPGPLTVRYKVQGFGEEGASLDPARLGGKTPERVKSLERIEGEQEFIEAKYEPGEELAQKVVSKKGDRQIRVAASGRFRYRDNNDVFQPVRRAKVEIWNIASSTGLSDPDLFDSKCGEGSTDTDGNFNIEVDCGDGFSGPDLAARIVLDNSKITVRPEIGFAYSFQSGFIRNVNTNTLNFGNITIGSNRGAFNIHNLITRAERFMKSKGENMDKVTALWPMEIRVSNYSSFFREIRVDSGAEFNAATIFHEYGHHVLSTKAESPSPDYDNGICDPGGDPGHCIDRPEKGVVSWTEGWPTFLAAALFAQHQAEDGFGGNLVANVETRFTTGDEDEGKEDRIEGVITALLWDLIDSTNDDQFEEGAGRRDRVDLSFSIIWDVIKNFDPSSDIFHNHPTSIHELWSGLKAMRPNDINLISEAYREHGILKDQPDLQVTATGALPNSVNRGSSFSLSNTVRNLGNDPANSGFTVRAVMTHIGLGTTSSATRTVGANLSVNGTNTGNITLNVPANAAMGSWSVQVCADVNGNVPESDETNNCRPAGMVTVTVPMP